ncbi:zinc finger and BTB domain containing 40 (predicted)-like protein, partial [Leptotrombidium deliense]
MKKGVKRHKCKLCGKELATKINVAYHILSKHRNERRFKCKVCRKQFFRHSTLFQHLALHQKFKKLVCNARKKHFKSKADLLNHTKRLHSSKSQIEIKSNKEVESGKKKEPKIAIDREAVAIPVDHFPQPITDRSKPNVYFCHTGVKYSLVMINGIEKYRCKLCQKFLSSKKCAKAHIKNIHNKELFSSEHCKPKLISGKLLQNEPSKYITGVEKSNCKNCHKDFDSAYEKINHVKHCHQNRSDFKNNAKEENEDAMSDNELECKQCSQVF